MSDHWTFDLANKLEDVPVDVAAKGSLDAWALMSIAVSLKRIADAMSETNEYGEGPAAAIGGNIARSLQLK